ncbi:Fis family transcriptional regulator [Caballeronia choica]|jgi:hypothetical protein|nr:Fis family transcriptional regulator [Caballeronia choica]
MPISKKRRSVKAPRDRSKGLLLPMPRHDSDAMSLRSRLAFEAMRAQRATARDVRHVAQAVLLTGFMTEAGHGLLELPFIEEVEKEVLALLDQGKTADDWKVPETLLERLPSVINEHDRQFREVRLGVVKAACERLDRMVSSAITRSKEGVESPASFSNSNSAGQSGR